MKSYAINKRASFDYELLSRYEAGIILSGQEVKSVKNKHVSLKGSFVTLKNSECYLTNAHINPYKFAGKLSGYNPTRPRKLLLKKNEISSLIGKSKTQGLTLVPIKLYGKRGYIKLEFALGRGKKQYDKRSNIAKREFQRKKDRALREKEN